MKASIENLIKEFIAVVFEKDELEFQEMSQLIALLPLLTNQVSNSDAENKFKNFQKRTVHFKYRFID